MFSSAGLGWSGIEVARFTGFDELSLPASTIHHALVYLNRAPLNLAQRLDGSLRKGRVHRGEVTIVPVGVRWEWAFGGEGRSDVLPLCLEDSFLREVARSVDVDPDGLEIAPLFGEREPRIERIGSLLAEEIGAEGLPGGRLYAESLATALAITLIREHSSLGKKAAREVARERAGGLPRRTLMEVVDYIGDNLGSDLKLADLARVAHMSPYHFARLFKESTGLPPHRYVVERRVRRAHNLLRNSVLPVAEIALRCGFANQSHLNRHLKRLLGVSPTAVR